MAEGSRVSLSSLMDERNLRRLRDSAERMLCERLTIQLRLQRGDHDDLEADTLKLRLNLMIPTFLKRVRDLFRRGAKDRWRRFPATERLGGMATARMFSFVRVVNWADAEGIRHLLDLHFPEWRRVDSIAIDELDRDIYQKMRNYLQRGTLDRNFLDCMTLILTSDVSMFGCDQLVFVSFKPELQEHEQDPGQIMWMLISHIFETGNKEAIRVLEGLANLTQSDLSELSDDSDAKASATNAVHDWMKGFLVTPVGSWDRVRPSIEEHFPTATLPDVYEPPREWHWLCENSSQLLVFPVHAGLGVASELTQYQLRRFVALGRCLRGANSDMQPIVDLGVFSLACSADEQCKCRLLSLPLSPPPAGTNAGFVGKVNLSTEANETDEFQLAGYPFVTAAGLNHLAEERFGEIWEWLNTGESAAAGQSRHALECFETAMSLGGARGGIAGEFEDAWRVIALMTCLEALYLDVNERTDRRALLLDRVYASLRAAGLSDTRALEARSLVGKAADARNAAVHAGLTDHDFDEVRELGAITGTLLREKIHQGIGKRAP